MAQNRNKGEQEVQRIVSMRKGQDEKPNGKVTDTSTTSPRGGKGVCLQVWKISLIYGYEFTLETL
eukprot:6188333-Pleurochrysis_carterae.AAC.3